MVDSCTAFYRTVFGRSNGDEALKAMNDAIDSAKETFWTISAEVTVQALWNVGTDFVLVPFAVISYALGDEAGAHEAIAA